MNTFEESVLSYLIENGNISYDNFELLNVLLKCIYIFSNISSS